MGTPYYDHEPAYARLRRIGGKAWDDLTGQSHMYKVVHEFLNSRYVPEGRDAIDFGCGGGQVSFILDDFGFRVTGIDYSNTAIDIAKENARENGKTIDFRKGDVLDLEFITNAAYDLVIDHNVSHCILPEDRGRYFREVERILKIGGIYFASMMAADPFSKGSENTAYDVKTRIGNQGRRYYTTEEEFISELIAHNLTPRMIRTDFDGNDGVVSLTTVAKKSIS